MALVRIEVMRGLSPAKRRRVMAAVHEAVIDALQVPPDDPTVRIVEHDPADVIVPSGKTSRYTVVEITMFAGRSLGARRQLYEAIVGRLAACGVPANDVLVVLHEVGMENWGIEGGRAASEVDLTFRVDV